MKILFFDPSGWNYDTTTPGKSPLGGTQSAVAYLSARLADIGHEVMVINGVPNPTFIDGVRFTALPCPTTVMNEFDVMITVGTSLGRTVRDTGYTGPLVLWCHHANDQGAVQPLRSADERDAYQGYAMVSLWQAQTYVNTFGIAPEQIAVLRNAASPPFHATTPARPWTERGEPPVLAYTSTPYRGLDVLLQAFPAIRARVPGTRLKVFSGMGIYDSGLKDGFSCLYDLCRSLNGVEYVGPLSQSRLAEEMAAVDILSYPSTFAETSCIAVMEAMASGSLVVSSQLGALPETTAGFARLIPVDEVFQHRTMFATRYAAEMVRIVRECEQDTDFATTLERQAAFARSSYNWHIRALEWQNWLETLIACGPV